MYEQIFMNSMKEKSKFYFPGSVFVAVSSSLENIWTGKLWGLRLIYGVWKVRTFVIFKHKSSSGRVTQKKHL